MDFQSFKRRDLQALCKLNKLPANTTNAAMADSLASLPTVEGLEEFLENLASEHQGSPERSVIPKSNGRRNNTRQKAVKEELECSNLGTKSTRLRTRTKAVEETDTRTRTTRTTRNRASQESSILKMDKDLQAEFEAGMEQSQISENNVLLEVEHQDIPEADSGVSVENEGQLLSKSQCEAQNAVEDGQEIVDVDNGENNKEEDHIVNDMQAEDSEMLNESNSEVDYHSLSRKDLQNLCKKNKIPANMTNAAMADALESLEVVEGLQDFLKGSDYQALSSPVAGIYSSCSRQSRTIQKVTKEEPRSSKLITKSCRVSRRRIIEETNQAKDDVPITLAALYEIQEKENSAVHKSELKKMENLNMETSEVSGVAEFNADIGNSLMEETTLVTESTLEDDSGKVNNDLPSVENSKEPEELASQVGENVVEEVLESAEVDIGLEVVTSCVDDYEMGVQQSKNVEIDADNEAEDGQLENLDNFNADDQTSKEVVSEFSTQADEPSMQSESEGDETKIGNDSLDKGVTTTQSDKPSLEPNVQSESDGGYTEDEMFEKSDSEATSQDDHLSIEVNVESESEETHIEDNEMSAKFDFKAISQDVQGMEVNVASESEEGNTENEAAIDHQFSLETNVEVNVTSESEEGNTEAAIDDQASLETNVESIPEAATDSCWFEKPEDSNEEDAIFNKFNREATIPASTNSCSLTEKELYEDKSLRQLKMLYKEKLQEAKLAKKMENLSLKETEFPMAKVEEDLQECLVESEIVSSPSVMRLSENEQLSSIVVPQTIPEDEAIEDHAEESEENTSTETNKLFPVDILSETNKLFPVDILLDNEVASENSITGNIDVVTSAPQSTPSKCSNNTKKSLLPTQIKSSSKPQVSVGTKGVLVDNKENIDSSVSKTGPGKIKNDVTESIDIVSPLSMAKLKRDYKFLKQQSETKKQALQSRSGNLLASP